MARLKSSIAAYSRRQWQPRRIRSAHRDAPVEANHILGDLIERGSAHGVATPLLKAALVNLRVYQDKLPKH
jgi:ketopantoate reductase